MENNKFKIFEKLISFYLKDPILYIRDDGELGRNTIEDFYETFEYESGYIYKKDKVVGSITKFKGGEYHIGIHSGCIHDILSLSGYEGTRSDFNEYNDSFHNIASIMQRVIADKINQYFLLPEGNEPITKDNMIGFSFITYPSTKYERRINLY